MMQGAQGPPGKEKAMAKFRAKLNVTSEEFILITSALVHYKNFYTDFATLYNEFDPKERDVHNYAKAKAAMSDEVYDKIFKDYLDSIESVE